MGKLGIKEIVEKAYYHEKNGMLLKGDCLEWMNKIPCQSIDMILCDLPYGTTACKWDEIIPFDKLWEQYERIIKEGGAICLFGSEPFSSKLRMSNLKLYKYDWIWNKKLAGNGILAKKQPLKIHEIVSVFNSKIYYPQKTKGKFRKKMGLKESEITGGNSFAQQTENDEYYPTSIQEFGIGNMRIGRLHPTQKPVDLLEYLIKTYTFENEIVLDNCAGSCSTAIASKNTNRKWICIEQEEKYCDISVDRIKSHKITP
jgi:site-specific DNA-methyltransferase (adenine-specific)